MEKVAKVPAFRVRHTRCTCSLFVSFLMYPAQELLSLIIDPRVALKATDCGSWENPTDSLCSLLVEKESDNSGQGGGKEGAGWAEHQKAGGCCC